MSDDNDNSAGTGDRDEDIMRQASMHFASRIVAAKIENGHMEGELTEDEFDAAVSEEINKWMRKFRQGINVGQIPYE